MVGRGIDAIATELLQLPPAEFTAARNARASAESDRELAREIKAIAKPSVAAWSVSLLASEGGLADALELAAALGEAQNDLDAAELQTLSRQRRALVAALAKQAAALATARGVSVSSAATVEIEGTIDAAVRDAGAAEAVQSGRLVRTLIADGIDPVDLEGAVAGTPPSGSPPPPRDDLAERRARKQAEKNVREAERIAAQAARELGRLDERLTRERERADHAAQRIADLRVDLARHESDLAAADGKIAGFEEARRAAASVSRDAEKAAARARTALTEKEHGMLSPAVTAGSEP